MCVYYLRFISIYGARISYDTNSGYNTVVHSFYELYEKGRGANVYVLYSGKVNDRVVNR